MILVTGATGFVGREVLRQALAAGEPLRALLRTPQDLPGIRDSRVVGDLSQPLSPSVFDGCSAVIHCAARAHVMKETSADPETSFLKANCEIPISVAEAAAAAGVRRFVFVSSIKVLGECTEPGQSFRPNDAPSPQDPYGRSKAAAERELHAVATRTGIELVIVRPPLVHGIGARGNLAALVDIVARGIPLPVASIVNRRSLVQVENLADLLLAAAVHPAAVGQTFHASDGAPVSTPEIIRSIADGLHHKARMFRIPVAWLRAIGRLSGREAMVSRLVDSLEVDATSSARLLNWRPRMSSHEGLRRMAEAMSR